MFSIRCVKKRTISRNPSARIAVTRGNLESVTDVHGPEFPLLTFVYRMGTVVPVLAVEVAVPKDVFGEVPVVFCI